MWAYVTDNTIQEIIRFPKSMVIDSVRHPRTIFTAWTWDELNAIGIYQVVDTGTVGDDRFQSTSQATYTFDATNKRVTTSYTVVDLKLDDTTLSEKDEKGNAIVILGLKSEAKNLAKKQANGFINRFNWLVERSIYDSSKSIPDAVKTYVAAIRTDCGEIETAIDGASDMAAFKLLYADTYKEVDGEQVVDVVARVNRWTDSYEVEQYAR